MPAKQKVQRVPAPCEQQDKIASVSVSSSDKLVCPAGCGALPKGGKVEVRIENWR